MLTQLEIINDAIKGVGLAPVSSIDSKLPSFLKAKATFDRVNSEVQLRGWWFNDYERTLQPNTQGKIIVPQYAQSAYIADRPMVVIRGSTLYDHAADTDVFSGPLRARIVTLLPIEMVPAVARNYIAARTKLAHYIDEDGQDPKLTTYTNAMTEAEFRLVAHDTRNRQVSSQESTQKLSMKYPTSRSIRVRGR